MFIYIYRVYLLTYISKKNSIDQYWHLYNYAVKSGIIYSIVIFIYTTLKHTVNMPRPICSLSPGSFQSLMQAEEVRCHSSFPSAHVALAVLITYTLWPWLNKIAKIFAILIVSIVAISRITLALHYPSDLIYSTHTRHMHFTGNTIFHLFKNNIIHKVGQFLLYLLHRK